MGKKKRQEAADEEAEEKAAGKESLYDVLGVGRTASQEEIRKAYHKLALRLHPDKNPNDENAKEKFQSLQSVIAILGDAEKRKVYDETGSVDDVALSGEGFQNLYQFFRGLYQKVTEEDIDAFAASYRGSSDETKDLKAEYKRWKGNMNQVFFYLMCSDPKRDSHRFMDFIDSAVSAGELKEFKLYRKWATEVAKELAPLNPLAPPKGKKKNQDEPSSDLLAMISNRGKERMNALTSAMEAKYGGGRKGRGTKMLDDEPSEEAFAAAQKRIEKRVTMKKAKKKGREED